MIYDRLLFRPLVAWADKFRFERTVSQVVPRSWVLKLLRRSALLGQLTLPFACALHRAARAPLTLPRGLRRRATRRILPRTLTANVWVGLLALLFAYVAWQLVRLAGVALSAGDWMAVARNGALTLARVIWNASIVAESVNWGPTTLSAGGLGAYIAERTVAGDFPRIALGIAAMSALVIAMNRLLGRLLYRFAEQHTRLD